MISAVDDAMHFAGLVFFGWLFFRSVNRTEKAIDAQDPWKAAKEAIAVIFHGILFLGLMR